MQKEIKGVIFNFENCESFSVEGKHIGHFLIDNIKKSIRKINVNSIKHFYTCEHFSMLIHRDADIEYNTFNIVKNKKFDRLIEHNDIASITIVYKDGTRKEYHLKWDNVSRYINYYQKTIKNKLGDLYIVVDQKQNIEDVFARNLLDDKNVINFYWKMLE